MNFYLIKLTDTYIPDTLYIQGVPRKSPQMFFVITSARNELATLFLDMFETNIRVVYDKIFRPRAPLFLELWAET